jgi:hypothetical protein
MPLPVEDRTYYATCILGHVSELDRQQALECFGEEIVEEMEDRGLPTEDDIINGRLNQPLKVLPDWFRCKDCQVINEIA